VQQYEQKIGEKKIRVFAVLFERNCGVHVRLCNSNPTEDIA